MFKLQTDKLDNPVGIDNDSPVFSWIIPFRECGQLQTAYRVMVSSSEEELAQNIFDIWDSGKIDSDETLFIKYQGKKLEASTKYFWKVSIWDKDGVCTTTETASFETGLMGEGFSGAEFISAPKDKIINDKYFAAPILRKTFNINKKVKYAKLYATAHGCFEPYVNGIKVGNDYFYPSRTENSEYLTYVTFDVTGIIKKDKNAIGVQLGNGWFNFDGVSSNYGPITALKLKLKLAYADGTFENIVTDNSWKSTLDGPVCANEDSTEIDNNQKLISYSNSLYYGEAYDATHEIDGFALPDFDDRNWLDVQTYTGDELVVGYKVKDVIVSECGNGVGIKQVDILKVQNCFEPQNGVYVYDFGQNFAGVVRIKAKAPKGTRIMIRHSEYLFTNEKAGEEGTPVYGNIFGRNGKDFYTFRGDENGEVFSPTLTYHGFRYISITGLFVEPQNIEGIVLSSATKRIGDFECSNGLINKFAENVDWSIRANFESIITDCPTREKNGWTGDAQSFCRASTFRYDLNYMYKSFLGIGRVSQDPEGRVAQIFPARWGIYGYGDAPSAWSDAVIIIPWEMYNQLGDVSYITDNYEMMKKWAEYLIKCDGEAHIHSDCVYGDHLNFEELTDNKILCTAYCAYSMRLLSRMANIIQKSDDGERYFKEYLAYKKSWLDNFVEADGCTIKDATQAGYVLGIVFDLFDEDKIVEAGLNLKNRIEKDNMCQRVGYTSIGLIYRAFSKAGLNDFAFKLFEQTKKPSVLYSVTRGATSIWEAYFGGSLNHLVHGAPYEWLITDVLGIEHHYENPGYKHFILQPNMGGSLQYANGSYESVRGTIKSGWRMEEDGYTYECTVPANTTATLMLPVKYENVDISEHSRSLDKVKGIKSFDVKNDKAIINVDSGFYSFKIQW